MRRVFLSLLLLLSLAFMPVFAEPHKVDTRAVFKLMSAARRTHSDTVLLMHDGKVLVDYRRDDGAARPIELMSVTKGFVGLAVGLLLRDGKLTSLDTPVYTFYPEWKQGRKQQITLRMLMNHTSGLQNVPNTGTEIYPAKDGVQLALAAELDADPGSAVSYNNKAVNLLAGVIAKAAGMPLDAYLKQALFAPLGIEPGPWDKDEAGNCRGMAGLPMRADDLAKIGQLVLDQGRWQQRQLLPAEFVREMLTPSPLNDRFGLLWFLRPAWQEVTVTAAAIAQLRAAGAGTALLDALRQMQDRRFPSATDFYEVVGVKLGGDGRQLLESELAKFKLKPREVFDFRYGPRVYQLDGYLGQYLIVVPGANVIAVRQIEYSDGWIEADGYDQFLEHVVEVASSFDRSYRRP